MASSSKLSAIARRLLMAQIRHAQCADDAVAQFSRLTEVIRYKNSLAMPGHQRVDGSEKHCRSSSSEDRPWIAFAKLSKTVGDASIEPALSGDYGFHRLSA